MTTHSDDDTEPPIVVATQDEAQRIVQSICDYLAALGWDYALVSIARRHDVARGHAVAPGATGMHVDTRRMAPALDNEADALEVIARQLRAMTQLDGVAERGSYVHDKSDYAVSGLKEWPR